MHGQLSAAGGLGCSVVHEVVERDGDGAYVELSREVDVAEGDPVP